MDSVESALAAERGGADRLELCQNLVIGGTTPSCKLFETIRKYSKIPIHVLLRPRFGDFCYTQFEFEMLCAEAAMYRELGAEGVVIGMLLPDGTLDIQRMEKLMETTEGMSVTLHRAFDVQRSENDTGAGSKAGYPYHSYIRAAEQCVKRSCIIKRTKRAGSWKDSDSGRRRNLRRSNQRTLSSQRSNCISYVWKNRTGQQDGIPEGRR